VIGSARLNVFSIVYGVTYMGMFFWNELYRTALFRYYPVLSTFSREDRSLENAGPAILWYSWLFGAAVIALVAAFVVPRAWAERIGQVWVWGIPALLIVILVYERRWFY
jgi:hypothetical protein